MKKCIPIAALLALASLSGLAQAQEQQILFCSESISYNTVDQMDAEYCGLVCRVETNTKPTCLKDQTDAGWQIVTASPKEIRPNKIPGKGRCLCVGNQYVLKRELSKPAVSTEKVSLLEKEIELLKKENEMLRQELEQLKSKPTSKKKP